AGVFLWPRFERVKLHKRAAEAFEALAGLLEAERRSDRDGIRAAQDRAAQAVRTLREEYSATAKRPAGPTRRDRAFVEMVTELERTLEFLDRPFGRQISAGRTERAEGDRLAAEMVRTLLASAAVMKGGDPPDLLALEDSRSAHRVALDRWAAEALRGGESPQVVLDGLDADHALRVVSYLALAFGRRT